MPKPKLYPNLMPGYIPVVLEAIREGKWLLIQRRLIEPLTFVNMYGRSHFGNDYQFILKNPDEVIKEAEQSKLTQEGRERLEKFKTRVHRYREMNIDGLLIQAITENLYPDGLDPDFDGSKLS